MHRFFGIVVILAAAGSAAGVVTGPSGEALTAYFAAPDPASAPLISYDWDPSGNLYYMTGAGGWGPGFAVWRHDIAGGLTSRIHADPTAFSGMWVTANGPYVYFDNGSTYTFYRYDTAAGGPSVATVGQTNLWGLFFRGQQAFLSGADADWSGHVYYGGGVNSDGSLPLAGGLLDAGNLVDPSGPLAFDAAGNLYCGAGYFAGRILKYSAGEVAAALAGTAALSDPGGHLWTDFTSTGLKGATGMAFDVGGDLVATLTEYGMPSQLVRFSVDGSGGSAGMAKLAESQGRMCAVRLHEGQLYVNDADGIYAVPEPATTLMLGLGLVGVWVRRRRSHF